MRNDTSNDGCLWVILGILTGILILLVSFCYVTDKKLEKLEQRIDAIERGQK